MKTYIKHILVGSILISSLWSCEEDTVDKPINTPSVVIDSMPNPTSTLGTLTIVALSGAVINSGNLAVTRGAVLDTSKRHLVVDSALVTGIDTTNGGEGVGSFKMKIFRLASLRKYYYRLYAKNWKGVAYSPIDSFISAPVLPKLTLDNPTGITNSSVNLSGKLTSDGGEPASRIGICYGLGKDPDIRDTITQSSYVIYGTDLTVGATFSGSPTGLLNNRNYYVRAFAINRGGTGYSAPKTFTTLP